MENVECCLCNDHIVGKEVVTLGVKGSGSINKTSKERGDVFTVNIGQNVHKECRKNYLLNRSNKRKSTENEENIVSLRSSTCYNYLTDCLFCGQKIPDYHLSGKKTPEKSFTVRTKAFQETVKSKCLERNDEWAKNVLSRIEYSQDLIAFETVYHQSCSTKFRNGRELVETPLKKLKRGRKIVDEKEAAFFKVIDYLENIDSDPVSLNDLVFLMSEYMEEGIEPFTSKHLKARLVQHFGDRLFITEVQGKKNIVTLRSTASNLITTMYKEIEEKDTESQKLKIIETAAKLIENDIKYIKQNSQNYPNCADIKNVDACLSYLPNSLKLFIDKLFSGKESTLKTASVGQAIMQAVRPKSILAPLQLTLAIQLHLLYGSKRLIEILNELGFCCAYTEVQKFEKCAAVSQKYDIPDLKSNQFVQFMADNVDHNVRTLDGMSTFHGMGIMATVTPGGSFKRVIPKENISSADVIASAKVDMFFKRPVQCSTMMYTDLQGLVMQDKTYNVDVLWKISWLLRPKTPLWNGTMQLIYDGPHPGESSAMFLPMIDMDPNNETCVYSTLTYIACLSRKYNIIPVVTFDQPLWWKAMLIVDSEPLDSRIKKTVLRLGGLHTEMSFLGTIGHLMTDSGLKELLQTVYADNTVPHMLSGKAIARAIRGHFLAETALVTLIVSKCFDIDIPKLRPEIQTPRDETCDMIQDEIQEETDMNQNSNTNDKLEGAMTILDDLINRNIAIEEAADSKSVQDVVDILVKTMDSLKQYRTAKLWIQYLEMLDILKRFIKAERTGNWLLHLQSLSEMIPYFAASGHNSYTKSVNVYLGKMINLKETHPAIHEFFTTGYHVIRRSNRYWAGLSSDLVIEQMLMRSLKSVGGLTRGRGMDETQRSLWILSRPACSEINSQMQTLTGLKYTSSDQHQDCGYTRQKRDRKDVHVMIEFLKDRNPYSEEEELRSISSGVVADHTVNVEQAKEVGQCIVKRMSGNNVLDFVFKRKSQVVTMNDTAAIQIDKENVKIDPQLLFQRLITAAQGSVPVEDLHDYFGYELCTFPPALFESSHLMREANKATFGKELTKSVTSVKELFHDDKEVKYVVDGGSLLQKISWPRGRTYDEICQMYVKYLTENYTDCTVVFDGYDSGPSTKDNTHIRRTGGQVGARVKVQGDLMMNTKKQQFLLNKKNKQQFILLLSYHLRQAGICTIHAEADADYLIVKTAVNMSTVSRTVVVGEDTDLLVLLCYYANDSEQKLYLQKEGKNGKCFDILAVKQSLGMNICKNILFLHAVLGCDTVSKPSGLGKPAAIRIYKANHHFRESADTFDTAPENISKEEIIQAGERAMVCLYNADPGATSLNLLRMKMFFDKTASNSVFIAPKSLPPTAETCKYHSLRVYHQILTWKGIDADATEFGWRIDGATLHPIKTDLPPAPPNILNIVRCSCKTGCKSMLCSCRKLALPCTMVCRNCNGGCANSLCLEDDEQF